MNRNHRLQRATVLIFVLLCSGAWPRNGSAATLREDTAKAWDLYKKLTEARIERELESDSGFLVRDFLPDSDAAEIRSALARGDIFVRKMETRDEEGGKIKIPKGLVHHWYGSVLVPGVCVDELLAWIQAYDKHRDYFEEVEDSRLVSRREEVFEIYLRLRRKKVITVHYNTDHVVTYNRWSPDKVSSRSEAVRIAELEDPGTDREREKKPGIEDRGYLWRLDSYWRFKQVPEGVVVECESISLSRTIPAAFRWVVKPFITSVPKESLESALRPMRAAFAEGSSGSPATLHEETVKTWDLYKKLTEARIERELESDSGFLVRDFLPDSDAAEIRSVLARGDVFVRKMETRDEEGGKIKIPKGLVHHWYGSVLVPGVCVDELLVWIQAYDKHRDYFEEVEDSRLVSRREEVFEIYLRLRREKVITVRYNTDHVVTYKRWAPDKGSSCSEAVRIAELEDPGTAREREKKSGVEDRGYLWRLDSYWRFKQVPEGVIVECESISLSRTLCAALGWVGKPFITSVPKESIESALRPMRAAFAKG